MHDDAEGFREELKILGTDSLLTKEIGVAVAAVATSVLNPTAPITIPAGIVAAFALANNLRVYNNNKRKIEVSRPIAWLMNI